MTEFTYEEIHNKSDAIRLGKNRGWCTANNTQYYDTDYNSNLGRLFVLFKQHKVRPQYQIFFSKFGGIELRAKFNKYVDSETFFLNEAKSLFNWYKSLKQEKTAQDVNNQQMFDRTARLGECDNSYSVNYDDFHYVIKRTIVDNLTNEEINRINIGYQYNNYSQYNRSIRVKLRVKEQDIIRVHRKIETPEASQTRVGQVFHIAQDNILLVRIEYNRRPCYLISSLTEYYTEASAYDVSSNVTTVNYQDRKIELNFHLRSEYGESIANISRIENTHRTGNCEETIICNLAELVTDQVYFNTTSMGQL